VHTNDFPCNYQLLLREDPILAQMADPACSRLLTDVGVHPQLDVDEFGVLGRVMPSSEFQVTVPSFSNEVPLPIAVFAEVPLPRRQLTSLATRTRQS
jgi:hypothetical protein